MVGTVPKLGYRRSPHFFSPGRASKEVTSRPPVGAPPPRRTPDPAGKTSPLRGCHSAWNPWNLAPLTWALWSGAAGWPTSVGFGSSWSHSLTSLVTRPPRSCTKLCWHKLPAHVEKLGRFFSRRTGHNRGSLVTVCLPRPAGGRRVLGRAGLKRPGRTRIDADKKK